MKSITEELEKAGFTDIIKINHKTRNPLLEDADITCVSPLGEKIGIIRVDLKPYSNDEMLRMKIIQLPIYDVWVCLCRYNNYQEVGNIVGVEYCIRTGSDFKAFIKNHGGKSGTSESDTDYDQLVEKRKAILAEMKITEDRLQELTTEMMYCSLQIKKVREELGE